MSDVKLDNRQTYLLKLKNGKEVFPVKWDNDQEHFYHYISDKDYDEEYAQWENDNNPGAGMPNDAEEAARMFVPLTREPKRYRVYKLNQVEHYEIH